LSATVNGTTVTLTWTAPAGAVTTYVVEAGSAAGLSNIASLATGSTATTLTVTSVPTGTFFVRVRARNGDGTGNASNEVTFNVGGGPCPLPSAPTGLSATASGNTLTLQWNAVAGALSYSIEAGSTPGATNIIVFNTGSAATSFTGAAPNGTYYIRVRVTTACGASAPSNEVTVTIGGPAPPPPPPPPPPAPTTPDVQPRIYETGVVISHCQGGAFSRTFTITAPAGVSWTVLSSFGGLSFNTVSGTGSATLVATVAQTAQVLPGPQWRCVDSEGFPRTASFQVAFSGGNGLVFLQMTYFQTNGNLT
jgi:predicted phage tail protein